MLTLPRSDLALAGCRKKTSGHSATARQGRAGMTTFMHFTAARYTPRGWDNVTAIFRYFGWPVLTARLVFPTAAKFAADSPLEGTGFEPSVPLPRLSSIRAVRAEIIGRSTDVFRRDREFDVSALQGRLSTSSQSQCSTDPGLIAGTWHRSLFLTRDRWFESGSLQRRVWSHQ